MCGDKGGADIEETEDQVAQQQVNAELWNFYQTSYKPLLTREASTVTDPAVKALEEKKVAGAINADVMKAVSKTPASANPVANTRAISEAAKLDTAAQVTGQAKSRSREIGQMQNMIDIGRGEATTAQAGLNELAGQSLQKAITDESLKQETEAATENAIGSAAGAVAGLAWDKYKNGTTKPDAGGRLIDYDVRKGLYPSLA